ncbi:hypothetical protein PDY_35490 [Photobacterium damselae subsp. damselae]|nr:hypothetical protein PDY_35490 [Photobacterium damselae subsp. damselae]
MSSVLSIEHTLVFIWKTQINKARVSISTNKLWGTSKFRSAIGEGSGPKWFNCHTNTYVRTS